MALIEYGITNFKITSINDIKWLLETDDFPIGFDIAFIDMHFRGFKTTGKDILEAFKGIGVANRYYILSGDMMAKQEHEDYESLFKNDILSSGVLEGIFKKYTGEFS